MSVGRSGLDLPDLGEDVLGLVGGGHPQVDVRHVVAEAEHAPAVVDDGEADGLHHVSRLGDLARAHLAVAVHDGRRVRGDAVFERLVVEDRRHVVVRNAEVFDSLDEFEDGEGRPAGFDVDVVAVATGVAGDGAATHATEKADDVGPYRLLDALLLEVYHDATVTERTHQHGVLVVAHGVGPVEDDGVASLTSDDGDFACGAVDHESHMFLR